VFDKAMRKSVQPYLEPGEDVLAMVLAQGKGSGKAMMLGGAVGAGIHAVRQGRKAGEAGAAADEPAVRLASRMGVVVTPKRLLVFKGGGQLTMKATELLSDIPIGDVDAIEIGKGVATKPITLVVRGESFTMEAPRAQPVDELPKALEQARGMSRV
jgi:hypothetical protein